jgi:sugar/nucleoside kinase (ribokinase family)
MKHHHELCCVGHITLDKVVTTANTIYMNGGTSFYFAHAIKHFSDIDFKLVTALAESEMEAVDKLRAEGIDVDVMPSQHTVYFENIYGANQDNRTQRVLAKADPFTIDFLRNIDADIYHLGSLLADDFSLEVVEYLAKKGKLSIDCQGYLREVRGQDVFAVDWPQKKEFLKHITFFKANEGEMQVLTGHTDPIKAAKEIYSWGVKEVLLTFGSMGSLIYDGETFYHIPAYIPSEVVNATGAGDTYMTGYLYQRAKGASIEEAGRFAAAMTTLKIEKIGPFDGTKEDVIKCMNTAEKRFPDLQELKTLVEA